MSDSRYSDLVDVLTRSVADYGSSNLFGTKIKGQWSWITYRDFGQRVDHFRGGLQQIGIGAGDTVGVISANRVEWAMAAYATYGLGARLCPMYESQQEKDWRYILEDSGAKVLIASTYAIYETVRDWAGKLGAVERVFCMALPAEDAASTAALEAIGREHPTPVIDIDPNAVCGFIYTSGTTGKPKGVLLSHANICANINSVSQFFDIGTGDLSVSFLPWAHSFGQTCELHVMVSHGSAVAIAESVEKLIENFAEVRPTVLFSVPRIFNKIYDGLQKKMAADGGLKKKLFDAAMVNAEKLKQLQASGRSSIVVSLKQSFFDKLVFSKVRERFGGRLRYACSGGAALSPEVGDFINKLGIMVCEGYGLTETSPIVTTNRPGDLRLGSVGKPVPDVEVIIDTSVVENKDSKDGEILVKGPNVMLGYHGLPEETAAVMREDGAFRTGDLGHLDADGYLYITGRIKEQYKLENGKYVVPAPLEELLQLSPFIIQAFIHGFNKPFNVVLLVPDRPALEKWATEQGITGDYAALLADSRTQQLVEEQIEKYGKGFKRYELPRKFHLLADEFTVENGMLTPKLSVKRQVVHDHYQAELTELHGAPV